MMATLLLSQGTPMILASDEFGRTQGGNNAYRQDSDISWLDWDVKDKGQSLIDFTRKLTGLRHKHGILRHSRFLSGDVNEEAGRISPGSPPAASRWGRAVGTMPTCAASAC